jgi:signal transduction histidine kinase
MSQDEHAGEGCPQGDEFLLTVGTSEHAASSDESLGRELRREQAAWRERVLRGIGLSLLATCGSAFAWFALVSNPFRAVLWALAVSLLALAVAVFVTRLPFVLRAAFVLAALYLPSVAALALSGFSPNPFLGLCTLAVSGTLLFGRRSGLVLLGLALSTVALVSFAHAHGFVVRDVGWVAHLDSARPSVALRVLMIFAFLTTTMVLAVTYLLRRTEKLALEKARSLAKLQSEQRERERMAQDLELREAAFHKARELELLGRLAGTMAHDFNNALLVVWSALDELSSSNLPQLAQESLGNIRLAANQAAAATRQLRAFGPTAPRAPSELALTPLIEKSQLMFSRVLPQNIRLVTDVSLDVVLLADEGEVLRVLMNLALNARDAMREGGDLTLRVRLPRAAELPPPASDQSFVAIDVSDTGSGMSDEVQRRLFEPFFTTKQGSGTGLGLASVRSLLEAQGGSVSVTSKLGVGTTITLAWPVTAASAARAATPVPDSGSGPAVVLLVDDDEQVRQVLTRGLTRSGLTVLAAPDGASGLDLARRFGSKIQVLCTDCVMAGVPVRKLIAGYRDLHQGRVIVCSGYAPTETGLLSGDFDDFLPKPFSIAELAKRVRALARMP